MPFKIWQHPQGEMTVNEYIRRLAAMDKNNIDDLKRAALDKAAAPVQKKSGKKSRKQSAR